RHWNTIASVLLHTLEEPDVYLPVLLEDDDGITYGNDWALGFMRGVQARPGSWRDLIDSDEHSGPMLPIMLLMRMTPIQRCDHRRLLTKSVKK
ncbi:UPF0149 family protein, partial [Pseudomonas syringae]|uniref:UPF0149 family protein n=1 Tax=Pseudomonas syringae TaxID=317 RepID=UPI001EFBB012